MSVEAIVAEGLAAPPVAASAVVQSWASRAWEKLRAASPRSEDQLHEDLVAVLVNGFLDARTQGAAGEARLGEAVMDCVYALTDASGAPGAASPIGRLFRAVKDFLGKMVARARQAQPQNGEVRVG